MSAPKGSAQKARHTPGLWRVMPERRTGHSVRIASGNLLMAVAHATPDTPAKERAAFIVRACNAHAELLAALRYACDVLNLSDPEEEHPIIQEALKVADAAIAKAEGRP